MPRSHCAHLASDKRLLLRAHTEAQRIKAHPAIRARITYIVLQGVDTPNPVITLPNGDIFHCKYEPSMGTSLVVTQGQPGELEPVMKSNIILKAVNPVAAVQASEGACRAVRTGSPHTASRRQLMLCMSPACNSAGQQSCRDMTVRLVSLNTAPNVQAKSQVRSRKHQVRASKALCLRPTPHSLPQAQRPRSRPLEAQQQNVRRLPARPKARRFMKWGLITRKQNKLQVLTGAQVRAQKQNRAACRGPSLDLMPPAETWSWVDPSRRKHEPEFWLIERLLVYRLC